MCNKSNNSMLLKRDGSKVVRLERRTSSLLMGLVFTAQILNFYLTGNRELLKGLQEECLVRFAF